jgi:putative cell wall-binding protein/streptogramin lyase
VLVAAAIGTAPVAASAAARTPASATTTSTTTTSEATTSALDIATFRGEATARTSFPRTGAIGSDGDMWFDEGDAAVPMGAAIGKADASGAVASYPAPGRLDGSLAEGSDCDIWYLASSNGTDQLDTIAKMTTTGEVTSFQLPVFAMYEDHSLTLGGDGNIWFVSTSFQLVSVSPAGAIVVHPIDFGEVVDQFSDIVPVPGGTIGTVVTGVGGRSAYVTAPAEGPATITELPTTADPSVALPYLALGRDGVVHTAVTTQRSTDGLLTVHLDTVDGTGAREVSTVAGVAFSLLVTPDGTEMLGLADLLSGAVDRFASVSTSGTITKFDPIADPDLDSEPIIGPDGGVWFSTDAGVTGEYRTDTAGAVFTVHDVHSDGSSTSFSTGSARPTDLLLDPAGRVWADEDWDGVFSNPSPDFYLMQPAATGRLAGASRYETSVAVARAAFPDTAPVVYVASGADFPDALGAAAAAAKAGGPLLLTTPAALPGAVADEIRSLSPGRIVLVGGPAAVSGSVERSLDAIATTTRVSGADRYATARAVVEGAFHGSASTVYVATGTDFPDALSASAAAGAQGDPVVLVRGSAPGLDATTIAFLRALGTTSFRIAGGPNAVSTGIQSDLTGLGTVTRLGGADRFDTSSIVATTAHLASGRADVATGTSFADALSGATLAAATGSPLYVVRTTCVPDVIADDLVAGGTNDVTLIGGPAALAAPVGVLTRC